MDKNKPLLLFELSANNCPITDTKGNVISSPADIIETVSMFDAALADVLRYMFNLHEQEKARLKKEMQALTEDKDSEIEDLEDTISDCKLNKMEMQDRITSVMGDIEALQEEIIYQQKTEKAYIPPEKLNESLQDIYDNLQSLTWDY